MGGAHMVKGDKKKIKINPVHVCHLVKGDKKDKI